MKKIFVLLICLVSVNVFGSHYVVENKFHANKVFQTLRDKNFQVTEVRDLGDEMLLIVFQ